MKTQVSSWLGSLRVHMWLKTSARQIAPNLSIRLDCKQRRNANKSYVFVPFFCVKGGQRLEKCKSKIQQELKCIWNINSGHQEHILLIVFPPTQTRLQTKCYILQSSVINKKTGSSGKKNTNGSSLYLHFRCSAVSLHVGYIHRKKRGKKKKKSQCWQRGKRGVGGVDPSGDKLVLGRRAALCGRVRVRLVADDHFRRDA